jgi:hypothetical protein
VRIFRVVEPLFRSNHSGRDQGSPIKDTSEMQTDSFLSKFDRQTNNTMTTATLECDTPNASWLADGMLFAVAVVWRTSYGVTKGIVAMCPVFRFLAIRFLHTLLLLLSAWKKTAIVRIRETVRVGLPLGLILLSIFVCETFGVGLTSASNAAFLISLCVIFTPFVSGSSFGYVRRLLHLQRPLFLSSAPVC